MLSDEELDAIKASLDGYLLPWTLWHKRITALIHQAREAIAVPALRAEIAELRRDAERYRWLRSDGLELIRFGDLTPDTSDVGLDAAIDWELKVKSDAAIAKGAGT